MIQDLFSNCSYNFSISEHAWNWNPNVFSFDITLFLFGMFLICFQVKACARKRPQPLRCHLPPTATHLHPSASTEVWPSRRNRRVTQLEQISKVKISLCWTLASWNLLTMTYSTRTYSYWKCITFESIDNDGIYAYWIFLSINHRCASLVLM